MNIQQKSERQNDFVVNIKEDKILYTLNTKEKTASVVGNVIDDENCIFIPRSIKYNSQEYIVTKILENSFKDLETIRSIQFPPDSEIRRIEKEAFNGSSIESISIPSHVTHICERAFCWCELLESITIQPDSELQVIEKEAFANSPIKSITLPSDILELKDGWCCATNKLNKITILKREKQNISMFNDQILIGKSDSKSDEFELLLFVPRNINEITIPLFIKKIGSYSFSQSLIDNILIPSQVSQICEGAFNYCISLKKIEFEKKSELQVIEKLAFSESLINHIVIPSNVSELKDGWCEGTSKLTEIQIMENNPYFKIFDDKMIIGKSYFTSEDYDLLVFVKRNTKNVTIPSSIKKICSYSFAESLIESIVIPQKVTQICEGAFSFCDQLKKIEFQPNSELRIIDKESFNCCSFDSISIPQHVTLIAEEAFYSCHIKKIEIPRNSEIQSIGLKAFIHSIIEYIFIPSHVTKICEGTFAWCLNLKTIEFPLDTKLQIIESRAFYNSSIESITLPSDILELKDGWCRGTEKLNKITIIKREKQNISMYNDQILIGKNDSKSDEFELLLFVPRNIKEITIPSFIKKICPFSFSGSLIENISISSQVIHICEEAFSKCSQIQKIEIPSNSKLQLIDDYAFNESSINNFLIPPLLEKISKGFFSWCKDLKKIEFAENSNIKTIESAFYNSSIESISIPSSVTELKKGWCKKTSNLYRVEIMANNQYYKNYDGNLIIGKKDIKNDVYDVLVFASRNIKKVKIPPFIKIIDPYSFEDSQIKSIFIPPNVTQICMGAFQNCEELQKIEIPKNSNLQIIEKFAFLSNSFRSVFYLQVLSK